MAGGFRDCEKRTTLKKSLVHSSALLPLSG